MKVSCSYVRMPVGLLLGETIITEFIRFSFIFFVAAVTVSDAEQVGTLQHKPRNLRRAIQHQLMSKMLETVKKIFVHNNPTIPLHNQIFVLDKEENYEGKDSLGSFWNNRSQSRSKHLIPKILDKA